MDDVRGVRGGERAGNLHARSRARDRSPAGRRATTRVSGDAVHQLHDDEVDAAVRVDVVNGDDVGMVEGGGRPRFLGEAALSLVAVRARVQHLHRHLAAQALIVRLVDDAHAAAADLASELITRWQLQRHGFERSDSIQ